MKLSPLEEEILRQLPLLERNYSSSTSFEPSGNLLFTRNKLIYIVNAEGRHERIIAEGSLPRWSGDGKRIAYVRDDHLYTTNPEGVDPKSLASFNKAINDISWSPDSKMILVDLSPFPEARYNHLGSSDVINASSGKTAGSYKGNGLRWNGERTLVRYSPGLEKCSIDFISLPGNTETQKISLEDWMHSGKIYPSPDREQMAITIGDSFKIVSLPKLSDYFVRSGKFEAWSPDSKQIAFREHGYIMISSGAGKFTRQLGQGVEPAFSPDGMYLAYTVSDVLCLCNQFGTRTYRISNSARSPQWSPV